MQLDGQQNHRAGQDRQLKDASHYSSIYILVWFEIIILISQYFLKAIGANYACE